MQTILCMNAKGGCGKTTIATNLATWFADDGHQVALADFDPQGSSLDWLAARDGYEGIPEILGIDAYNRQLRPPRGTEHLIMDVPAAVHGKEIDHLLRRVETLIVPVLPSPIDIRATSCCAASATAASNGSDAAVSDSSNSASSVAATVSSATSRRRPLPGRIHHRGRRPDRDAASRSPRQGTAPALPLRGGRSAC